MIRIRQVRDAVAATTYFFGEGANSQAEGEEGVWIGKAVSGLGLTPEMAVGKQEFSDLLHGYAPGNIPVFQRFDSARIPGWDLVVSPPKSISIAANCLDPKFSVPVAQSFADAAYQSFRYFV